MTAPGDYRDGSLGAPLPGIETQLAEDGELLVRGPYVMPGYLDPPDWETGFDAQGWLRTGDLMQIDADGHLRLVDRKKEIYKNVQGETIAPQRVENLFRDFESVGRAFLVGDHREYNTLLIHPNPDYHALDAMSRDEAHDHFKRTMAGSKWENMRGYHVLRHSFISALASEGVDQRVIDEIVGHQSEEQRKRYRHLYPKVVRDAVSRVFG